MMTRRDRSRNTTADKALQILCMLDEDRTTVSAIEVAEHLGTSRSTAYRYLDTLLHLDFLEQDRARGFRIGQRIHRLSQSALTADRVVVLARDCLARIRAAFNETVVYNVRQDATRSVIQAIELSTRSVRAQWDVGASMPIHAGAPSLVLLTCENDAHLVATMAAVGEERFTEDTPVTVAEIEEIIRVTKEQGYYVSRGSLDSELVAVAAPIYAPGRRRVLSSIGVVLPSSRSTPELEAQMGAAVVTAAESIERRLEAQV